MAQWSPATDATIRLGHPPPFPTHPPSPRGDAVGECGVTGRGGPGWKRVDGGGVVQGLVGVENKWVWARVGLVIVGAGGGGLCPAGPPCCPIPDLTEPIPPALVQLDLRRCQPKVQLDQIPSQNPNHLMIGPTGPPRCPIQDLTGKYPAWAVQLDHRWGDGFDEIWYGTAGRSSWTNHEVISSLGRDLVQLDLGLAAWAVQLDQRWGMGLVRSGMGEQGGQAGPTLGWPS